MAVGFIGLGTMGHPMALNVLKGGFEVNVFDVNPAPAEALQKEGAAVMESVAELARRSRIIVTMLPTAAHVNEVLFGAGGVAEHAEAGTVVIQMSTIDPGSARAMAEGLAPKNVRLVDAPVGANRPHAAENGELIIMVGGEPQTIDEVMPVLKCMGKQITICGPVGAGSTVKLINNLLSATILVASCEAIEIARRSGIDMDSLQEVLGSTGAANNHLKLTIPSKVLKGDLSPGFKVSLAHKDLNLAMRMVSDLNVPSVTGSSILDLFSRAMERGFGDNDWTSVLKLLSDAE